MARIWIHVVYLGLLLYIWSMSEAVVSIKYSGDYRGISLIVALWGFSWFISYRLAIGNIHNVEGRRRLFIISMILGLGSLFTSRYYGDNLILSSLSYLVSTIALALGIGSSLSSIIRGAPTGSISSMVFRLRVYPGIVHASLAVTSSILAYDPVIIAIIGLLITLLLVMYEVRPLIPAVSLEVLDRFADALIEGPPLKNSYPVSLAAFLLAILSITRIIYLQGTVEFNLPLGITLYAGALALGAVLGSVMRSLRSSLIITVVLVLISLSGQATFLRLIIVSMLFSMLDVQAFLLTAIEMPSRLPELSWKISSLIMLSSLIIALIIDLTGDPLNIPLMIVAVTSAVSIILTFRTIRAWY